MENPENPKSHPELRRASSRAPCKRRAVPSGALHPGGASGPRPPNNRPPAQFQRNPPEMGRK